jgi:hypothetical protein
MDLVIDPLCGQLNPNPRHPGEHVIKMLGHKP